MEEPPMALKAPVLYANPTEPAARPLADDAVGAPAETLRFARETIAIHGGRERDAWSGAVLTPIVQSTTFAQRTVGGACEYAYSRCGNPTVAALEAALGALEDAPPAVAYSTGVGAVAGLFFGLLSAGDHVVVSDVVYGGTTRLLQRVLAPLGVSATFVDTSNPAAVGAAITDRTRLVLVETPGNPTLKLTDIAPIARITRSAGIPLAVDNTFLTPAILRPLDHGADISVYSTTKYIEGHNATLGGSITTRDEKLLERLRWVRKSLGTIQTPFEAWLTIRGIKTLPVRIREHSRGAQRIAEWLERHPAVERVLYPGLSSFPQHELAKRLHTPAGGDGPLHGGIITITLKGGLDAAKAAIARLELWTLAESLGAVESLVTHPATMTHAEVPREQRLASGIEDGLVRLSVGLEDPRDLIADLDRAFARGNGRGCC
jgi:cystathionine beta-lyase/cystathionine gamma-synthase